MAKKIRKIIDGKVKWFGTYSIVNKQLKYETPFLEVDSEESYIEAYKYRIYNLLKIIKGELQDKTYGIRGAFGKQTKEETDVEIQEALRKKLDLVINAYNSTLVDREYTCKFTVTTPKGYLLTMEYSL